MDDRETAAAQIQARIAALESEFVRLAKELADLRNMASTLRAQPEAATRPVESEPVAPEPAEPPPFWPPPPPRPTRPAVSYTPSAPPSQPPSSATAPGPSRPTPAAPAAPVGPPPRSFGDLARDWDLVGPRGFAIAGGAVTALGIGLFFVLAANRGWIDPTARVLLGAVASALVLGGGLLLRARYGQYLSALAAVGAGIAGGYATLAAAAARYDVLPDALALPLAGVIAAVATSIALRWRSQIIAALGLVGAALAPALQALDTTLSWESAAFAVIVLIAGAAVSVPLAWRHLLLVLSVLVGLQIEWLVADAAVEAGLGTVGVVGVFVTALIGISIGRQVVHGRAELDPAAVGYALAASGLTFLFSIQLFDDRTFRGGALLLGAAVWAAAFAALQVKRYPDLALVLGTSALAVAAVGTADLVSEAALTLAWAAQAVLFAFVASKLRDARLQTTSLVYAVLAAAHALAVEGRLDLLFDRRADHLAAVVPLAAAALGFAAAGGLTPTGYEARTESGLLAFVSQVRKLLDAHREGLREALLFAAALGGTLAASFGFLAMSFEWGHVGAAALAAVVGAGALALSGRLQSDALAVAAYYWLGVVVAVTLVYDIDEVSPGGWSVVAAASGLLAGAYVHRILGPASAARDAVCGVAASIAALAGALGIGDLADTDTGEGIGFLFAAAAYVLLAAGIFRRSSLRDVSTTLWSVALLFLVAAEALLVGDSVWRAVTIAATALGVGLLGGPLGESRLWLAGGALAFVTSAAVVLVQVQPWLEEEDISKKAALATGACALAVFGLAADRFRDSRWRDLVTVLWVDGILLVLATERVLLGGWQETAFVVALTGAAVAGLARPLREPRLWFAAASIVAFTTFATLANFTPPTHFFSASDSPAEGVWVLLGCLLAILVLGLTGDEEMRFSVYAIAGAIGLYALSLGLLDVAEHVSTASIGTDFERGHTAVSALWGFVGLGLLLLGLLRGSAVIRYGGLVLFGVTLAKIFLYDLAELSSIARAFSFIFVGALLLAGGFFLQRLSDRVGPRSP